MKEAGMPEPKSRVADIMNGFFRICTFNILK
jgi:hypothetical protein